ncbi:MAG TPA: 2-phosphosulfolactate phosphatase [Planctomycetaceae bacterium]|nr:2-phosphosulfolactate phosphatase [Planctomycetaceae bacterium]
MFANQSRFAVRFDWGERGLEAIGPGSAVLVIVDVLSFCTSVDIATARGAVVMPYRWRDDTAVRFAADHQAILASPQRTVGGYSLSPASLSTIPPETRLVLPSPNGATLSLAAASLGITVAACLRNAPVVARFVRSRGGPVGVVACGERWEDGSLRPAWEDLVGAGAVISELTGSRSPEAEAATDAFVGAKLELRERLHACASGRELIERGFASDVALAAAYAVSECVPQLTAGAFVPGQVAPPGGGDT